MSTILVDNLTGKTTAGDITVTSEGGAATRKVCSRGWRRRGLTSMAQALLQLGIH
jgi:hypothetical protein